MILIATLTVKSLFKSTSFQIIDQLISMTTLIELYPLLYLAPPELYPQLIEPAETLTLDLTKIPLGLNRW